MYPEPQEDVVDEHLVRSVGMAERRQHCRAETGNRGIIDRHWLVVQIANSSRVRILSDRVQRAARQIKKHNAVRLVQTGCGAALQIMETSLTDTYLGYGY